MTSVRGYLVSPLPRTPGPGPGLQPWAAPASPVSVLLPPATARVICSACRYHPPPIRPSCSLTVITFSCDDDFFCGWNCPKCSAPDFCSGCECLHSLGCARNCGKCSSPPAASGEE